MEKVRLDQLLVERGLVPTRNAARGLILAGLVLVEGQVVDKCGTGVPVTASLRLKNRPRYVSRGGDKLAHALAIFPVAVAGVMALDVGASTGGFVDCLLQRGAARVIAVDVGRGQLDVRLRTDPRVVVMEGVNARHLTPEQLPYRPELVTMDVSFISVEKILPAICDSAAVDFEALILVKPQFEAGRALVRKRGVVRDPTVRRDVVLRVATFAVRELGLDVKGVADSGLPGADGNREYFLWLTRGTKSDSRAGVAPLPLDNLAATIDEVVGNEADTRRG